MRTAAVIELSAQEKQELTRLSKSNTTSVRLARRARMILLAAEGWDNQDIAAHLGVGRVQVGRWRDRYAQGRLAAIAKDRPRGGRPVVVDAQDIVRRTTQHLPRNATHWSTRTLADEVGVSDTSVLRVWRAHGLKPHRVETFKVSRDPKFAEKLEDIVGLYLSPPEHALVLSCDEKSQIQALDRTQPGLPLKKGRGATMTHDYKRHGTTTLFAALDVLTGTVIGQCLPRHRHEEFLTFLKTIDAQVPEGLQVHLILDNYATHKHANVKKWLKKHPRFHLHFTPTSSSWLNQVERWFRDLTEKNLRRGIFKSVPDLIDSIESYLQATNADPQPYIWTATAQSILSKVARARTSLEAQAN